MKSKAILILIILLTLIQFAQAGQPPILPVIDKAMRSHLRNTYRIGVANGKRPSVFVKVGDSITRSIYFLKDIGCGVEVLAGHQELAPTIQFFRGTAFPPSFTTAWCGEANSFSRDSETAQNGWTAAEPLAFFSNLSSDCPPPDNNPLRCELRLIQPSIALIMFGTNDLEEGDTIKFRKNLTSVVQEVLIAGVVPVLSTIPPRLDSPTNGRRVPLYNRIIQEVADTLQVPLWNYWLILQSPGMINQGIDHKGIHPNVFQDTDAANFTSEGLQYGMNQRNVTALEVLKKLRAVVQNNAPSDTTTLPNFSIYPTQLLASASAGTTTILNVKISRINLADPVRLSLKAPPPGISGKFKTNAAGTTSILSLQVQSDVTPGTYLITVRGKFGALRRTTTFALEVTN